MPTGAGADVAGAALVIVEDGVVVLRGVNGRRIAIAIAGPGDLLGPLVEREELRGLTPARLTVVTRESERALMQIPRAAAAVADGLVAALLDRKASLANFARFPHLERVRGKLLQLAHTHGRVVEGGVLIDLPLTHDLLAETVASTRETVTLALQELERSGFLSRVDRRYRLRISPEELS